MEFQALNLMSLGSYLDCLVPEGAVSAERAITSVLDRWGLSVALPLAMFLPAAWRRTTDAASLYAITPFATLLLSEAISTLDLMAMGTTLHRTVRKLRLTATAQPAMGQWGGSRHNDASAAARDAAALADKEYSALDIMLGALTRFAGKVQGAQEAGSFVLDRDMQSLLGLSEEALLSTELVKVRKDVNVCVGVVAGDSEEGFMHVAFFVCWGEVVSGGTGPCSIGATCQCAQAHFSFVPATPSPSPSPSPCADRL